MTLQCCTPKQYFCDQSGHGIPNFEIYRGLPYQRGHGLFSSMFSRFGMPLLKYLGKRALKTGRDIAIDVLDKKAPFKQVLKGHLKSAGKSLAVDALERAVNYDPQQGSGISRAKRRYTVKRVRKRVSGSKPKKKKKREKTKRKQTARVNGKKRKTTKSKKFCDIFS
jgi:hypothetical protein